MKKKLAASTERRVRTIVHVEGHMAVGSGLKCAPTVSTTNLATSKAIRSFWLIGVLNNAPWVLMLACAPNISSGGVALVFLSNQIPGLIVKITAPYWFHNVSYKTRMIMASISMFLACVLVGCGSLFRGGVFDELTKHSSVGITSELIGVCFISFQCSLGEASSLALASKFDSIILPKLDSATSYSALSQSSPSSVFNLSEPNGRNCAFEEDYKLNDNSDIKDTATETETTKQLNRCITAFSSGTGLAGIVGYGYKSLLSEVFGLDFSMVTFSAVLFAVGYYSTFHFGLLEEEQNESEAVKTCEAYLPKNQWKENAVIEMIGHSLTTTSQSKNVLERNKVQLSSQERFKVVLSLWPYTIPLFTVYAAEYMLQAGVWSAIGFPVSSATARAQFYHYANWSYQAGVFISRSSGNMLMVPLKILWLMPGLQVMNLVLFWINSVHHYLYNYSLLFPCFYAGLLGGSVYVQCYSRINCDLPVDIRELALASAAVADSLGIIVADIASLFIQSCIYDRNNIEGAAVECPWI